MSFKPKHSIKNINFAPILTSPNHSLSGAKAFENSFKSPVTMQQSPSYSTQLETMNNSKGNQSHVHSKRRYPEIDSKNNGLTGDKLMDQSFRSNIDIIKKNFTGVFNNSGLDMLSQKKKDKQYFASYGNDVQRILNKKHEVQISQDIGNEYNKLINRSSSISFQQEVHSRQNKQGHDLRNKSVTFEKQRNSVQPPQQSQLGSLDLELRLQLAIKNQDKKTAFPSISKSARKIKDQQRQDIESKDSMRAQNDVLKANLDKMEVQLKETMRGTNKRTDVTSQGSTSIQRSKVSRGRSNVISFRQDQDSNQNLSFAAGSPRIYNRREANYSNIDIQDTINSQMSGRGQQLKVPTFRSPGMESLDPNTQSSYETLPSIAPNNKDKNDWIIETYQQQLQKQKKQRIMGVDEQTLKAETDKIILKQRAMQFIESQNKKIKSQIQMKSMSKIERAKFQEERQQVKLQLKQREKTDIDQHNHQMNKIVKEAKEKEHREMHGGQTAMDAANQKAAQINHTDDSDQEGGQGGGNLDLSQDSATKNVGVLGQYIARVIEDKEINPSKYENDEQDIEELLKKQLQDGLDELEEGDKVTDNKNRTNEQFGKSGLASKTSKFNKTKSQFRKTQSKLQHNTNPSGFVTSQSSFINIQDDYKKKFRDTQQKMFDQELKKKLQELPIFNRGIQEEGTNEGQTIETNEILNNNNPQIGLDLLSPISRKKKSPAKCTHEILSVNDRQQMQFETQTAFSKIYPEFKTGITPHRIRNESDMDPSEFLQQQEIVQKQKKKAQLYRKKDFDDINVRQKKFKDLMTTKTSEHFDKSDIVPQQSSKSDLDMQNFPFAGRGEGQFLKAYEGRSKRKQATKRKSLAFNTKRTDQEDQVLKEQLEKQLDMSVESALGDHLDPNQTQLAQIKMIQNQGDMITDNKNQLLMLKFLDYVSKESLQENIFQIQDKLGENFLSKGFESYNQIQDPQIAQFAQFIQERKQFYDMCKTATSPRAQEAAINDPNLLFFKKCYQLKIPVLSILQKRHNKALNLPGYFLNEASCSAIEQAFTQFPDYCESILLENNGLKDKGMTMILNGLNEMNYIKKFVCINNEIQYNAHCSLKKLLQRPAPNNLIELRLTKCRLNMTWTETLLDTILEQGTLKKLGLVRVNLHDSSVEKICTALENKGFLTDLDISWNNLLPTTMYYIAETLGKNRSLKSVNISWNSFGSTDGLADFAPPMEKKAGEEDNDFITIHNICKFIKYNPKLIHFDISKTGLSKDQLREIGPALRRAKSLLALHASGNPGVSKEITDELFARVHCQPKFKVNTIDDMIQENVRKNKDGFLMPNQLQEGLKLKTYTANKRETECGHASKNTEIDQYKLIFERTLGHKKDIPGSGQFKMLTNMNEKCWICEGYSFNLIFWTRRIGWSCDHEIESLVEEKIIQRLDELQERTREQIENGKYDNQGHQMAYNLELGTPGNSPEAPVIYGQFTNWHPMKMMRIEDYCDAIDQNQPDFLGRLMAADKCRASVQVYDDLNENEQEQYELLLQQYKQGYRKNWNSYIDKDLNYKNPNLLYKDLLLQQPDDYGDVHPIPYDSQDPVFVFPCYVKPGKHYFIVRSDPNPNAQSSLNIIDDDNENADNADKINIEENNTMTVEEKIENSSKDGSFTFSQLEPEYFSHRMITHYRTEEIPIIEKTYSSLSTEIVFKKNQSVFKDWKEDTDTKLKAVVEHDFALYKLTKFVKDEQDREKVENLIKKNLETLKIIHLYYASRSSFPYITITQYNEFISQFNLTDQETNISFESASKQPLNPTEGFQESHLLRFQFLEIIVRIAEEKYKKNKKGPQVTRVWKAVQQFITDDINPNVGFILEEWDGWRKTHLWTLEVHEMFKANEEGIKKLMEKYHQPRQKYLPMKEAQEIFTRDCDLSILEKDAAIAYGMCKMPLVAECKELAKYKRILNNPEFYEMIGRMAEHKYKDKPMLSLAEKIGCILEKILPIAGQKKKNPKTNEIVDESQSDEDY